MSFKVTGLSPKPFQHLFGLSTEDLAKAGAERILATEGSGLPDRVELRNANTGENLLLVNYMHQPADTPYRSSHAIFVIEGATEAAEFVDTLPPVLTDRLLSLRAFDSEHMMIDADVTEGAQAQELAERFLTDPKVDYIHVHYARRGCYAARIDRS